MWSQRSLCPCHDRARGTSAVASSNDGCRLPVYERGRPKFLCEIQSISTAKKKSLSGPGKMMMLIMVDGHEVRNGKSPPSAEKAAVNEYLCGGNILTETGNNANRKGKHVQITVARSRTTVTFF